MNINKTLTALIAGASLGMSGQVFAVGTESGTTITNNVTLSYEVSGISQNNLTEEAAFKVDTKIDMTFITSLSAASTIIPGAAIAPSYTLVNEGNKAQSFKFEISENTAQFTTPATTLTLTGASDASCALGGTSPIKTVTMNPDATCVFTAALTFPTKMLAGLPTDDDIVNGDTFTFRAKAIAVTDNTGTADAETSALNKNDPAYLNLVSLTILAEEDVSVTAPHTAYDGILLVDTGLITVETARFAHDANSNGDFTDAGEDGPGLTVKVINDPLCNTYDNAAANPESYYANYSVGNVNSCNASAPGSYTPKAIPGALVEYTITAKNIGPVSATTVVFTQDIADSGTYSEFLLPGTLGNEASSHGTASVTSDELTVNAGSVANGSTVTITFTAIVE